MPDLPPAFALFAAAFWLQVPAVLLFAAYAFKPLRGFSLAATLSLGASLGCLLLFMLLLGGASGRIPLASGFEALAFWGLCLGALVLWVEWRHRLGLLGAFLAPLSGLTLLMGFRFIKVASEPAAGLGDAWLLSHVAMAMFAYACFTVAAGVAGAYLVQERQLKAKRLDSLFYQLPPLQELEHLLALLAKVGTGALALGLHFGFVWRLRLDRTLGLDDPKVIFGFSVCLAYAALLKSRRAMKGRRFAWACLALFFAVFVGHYLVNVYLGGHGFLRAPGA